MSRISQCLGALKVQGRKALIPFITCGDPSPEVTVELMHTLVRAGADILELGVPFSDPMADGPTIQRASERALAKGMTLSGVLSRVAEFRKTDGTTPVVLMGYANPIEARGVERFVADARHAGVDGVLVVDYPPEECESFVDALRHAGIDPIFLLAPTSSESRMEAVGRLASGYVYYVSIKGVTGAGSLDTASVAERLPAIRARVGVPVGVGFGIRDGASARAVAEVADAVVVGSRIIEEMEQAPAEYLTARVFELVRSLRVAIDEVGTPTAEVSE